MGNGTRQQCEAVMKNGKRCTRKAHKGAKYCGTVAHQAQAVSPEPPRAGAPATPMSTSLEYADIATTCMGKVDANSHEPGVQVQWMRLALDAVRSLKDELRTLEAQFIQYHITYADPLEPLDDVPPMPELPPPEDP